MPNAAGRATRDRLIVTAERLFAQHGVEAVPLRDIAAAAAQRNVAATNYYFGTREDLVRAIFDYRLSGMEQGQEDLLNNVLATTAPGTPARVRGLVEAFAIPLVEQLEQGHFLGFIARTQLDFGRGDQFVADRWLRPTRHISALLRDEFPNLTDETFDHRMNGLILLAVHYLATVQHTDNQFGGDDLANQIVDMLVGILQAPSSAVAAKTPRRKQAAVKGVDRSRTPAAAGRDRARPAG